MIKYNIYIYKTAEGWGLYIENTYQNAEIHLEGIKLNNKSTFKHVEKKM